MHPFLNTAALVLRAMQKREGRVDVISYPCPRVVQILHGVEPNDVGNAPFEGETYGPDAALAQALYDRLALPEDARTSATGLLGLFAQVDKLLFENAST